MLRGASPCHSRFIRGTEVWNPKDPKFIRTYSRSTRTYVEFEFFNLSINEHLFKTFEVFVNLHNFFTESILYLL